MSEYFPTSLDHLLAELKRVELNLCLQALKLRQENGRAGEGRFRGLYVSEREMETILNSPHDQPPDNSAISALAQSLRQFETEVAHKKKESLCRGTVLRLYELQEMFHLSAFDIDALLVCALPELDLKYQKLYAYLQDDVTKKSPTVDLVLRLLCDSLEARLAARQAFSPPAPLIGYHLLRPYDNHPQRPGLLLATPLQVDERILDYLLGSDRIDIRLLPFASVLQPQVKLADVILPDDTKHRLTQLAAHFPEGGLVCHFQGGYGVGKQATAAAVCHESRRPLLTIDVKLMLSEDAPPEVLIPLVFREGLLQGAALYLDGCDALLGEDKGIKSSYSLLMAEVANYPQWVFFAGERSWEPRDMLSHKPFISLHFPLPGHLERRKLWENHRNGHSSLADDIDLNELAGKFRLSGGQINDAVVTAQSLARWRDPEKALVTTPELYTACRQQSGQKLNTLARQIQPRYTRADIILPRDQFEQLREICGYVKHYHTVYGDWGFGRKLSLGKGLNVLFAGPSGTGKTMAAGIMANELGLDLYKIDLSAIVSKYIGETEKNLERIFTEAQTSNAILFFDEADALFGKRSEVRDSHDRYANIEIAYLLQRMEEYDGIVILATNLRKNMDEAFARRMHFSVEFPMPEEADRRHIWQNIFPKEAPLAKDIDLPFMARQFKISGGNIKNIALSGAFLAAADGGAITMENLIRAAKREYQKMGKLCTEGDFAQYFELVKG
ncbi:MAG: ATP-binding protein [Dehalococcoidales bacterium]|nr:ATP-binding protein [Dehalococcoidales bacterium]